MNAKLNFEPKLFNPYQAPRAQAARPQARPPRSRREDVYVYSSDIILAVNAALATQRPLLVMGPPGTGKSTLARNVARHLGWRFYQKVVTSRTQAQDLLWTFDSLRRLRDAQAQKVLQDAAYVQPGALWWAFDPESAARRGGKEADGFDPAQDPNKEGSGSHAVVLLDEIDKADPDVPNDLLGPLDENTFEVTDLGRVITRQRERQVLLVITSNDERELSPAFVRRCILITLKAHDEARLVEIASQHFGQEEDGELYQELARQVSAGRKEAEASGARPPSTAEFLDAVAACLGLGLRPSSPAWTGLSRLVLSKFQPPATVEPR